MLRAALEYQNRGLSVIPVGKDKKPLIPWSAYQTSRASPQVIKDWWDHWPDANIAIITGQLSGVDVIDIDSAQGKNELFKLLPAGFITVTAQSPRGQHLYFKHYPGLRNNTKIVPGCDLRAEGGYIVAPPSCLDSGRAYKWVHRFEDVAIQDLPTWYVIKVQQICLSQSSKMAGSFRLSAGNRDESLFHVANCLIKGGMDEKNTISCLKALAGQCDPPFSQRDALVKVASAFKRYHAKQSNLTEEIKDWLDGGKGTFTTEQMYRDIGIIGPDKKRYACKVLRRQVEAGVLEPHGTKRGGYKIIDYTCEPMDWKKSSTVEFDLLLPFKLHEIIKTFPKSVILIAGEQNAGKTALMLNTVRWNQDQQDCHYFTSEMGEAEMKERLEEFDYPLSSWKFKVYPRSRDFHSVLKPNDLNFIDYLEVETDFWKVGKYINRIWEALDKGVAIIGLQKGRGAVLGRGGDFALEKPRLYVTLTNKAGGRGEIKIEKAKLYRDKKDNPNGKTLVFRIENGALFIVDKDWHMKEW